ncbi:MAG: dihydroneopterin aldolase [Clostridia bacterium]|nr:dihydroneopterin aldolase [Clostridia bacterium]
MDKIYIKDLTLKAHHGVLPEEKENGQTFILDITITADLKKARESDNLSDTVNYAEMIGTISAVFMSEKNDLIEHAAERVADAILKKYKMVESVTVFLKKPEAPINADFGYVAIEITKIRGV